MFNNPLRDHCAIFAFLAVNLEKNFPILNPCYQCVKKNIKKKNKKRIKKDYKRLARREKITTFAPALEQKFTHKLED